MKVAKSTVRNFLEAWYVMSDNPVDWDEGMGYTEKQTEKIHDFLNQLGIFAYGKCMVDNCNVSSDGGYDKPVCNIHSYRLEKEGVIKRL